MKTTAEAINAQLAALNADIQQNDKSIEDAERRQALRRQHGERLHKRRATLEALLRREEAQLVRPEGPCVEIDAHDGVRWRV